MAARMFLVPLVVSFLSFLSSPSFACLNSWSCATGPVIINYAAAYNRPCAISDGIRESAVPCQMIAAIEGGYAPVRYVYPTPAVVLATPCIIAGPNVFPPVRYVPILPARTHARPRARSLVF